MAVKYHDDPAKGSSSANGMRSRGATHELNRRAIDPVSLGPSLRISHRYEEFPDNHTSVDLPDVWEPAFMQ